MLLLGTEWKDHIWVNLKNHRFRRNKNKEQGPDYKCQVFNGLWSETPPAHEAYFVAIVAVADFQAGRAEAPNKHGMA